ncbi:MAG: polysaccharide lyase [Methylococcales bacterium]
MNANVFGFVIRVFLLILLAGCNVKEIKKNEVAAAKFTCANQNAALSVTPFSESFEQPNWGERYVWGYNADKKKYPPLDSKPFDGKGDSNKQPANTRKRIHRSVNTPAVRIVTAAAEGITARSGKLVKFTLRPGDVASDRNRAELQLFKNQDPMCSEAWYGWSVFIPKDFDGATSTKGFYTVGQWHAQRSKKSTNPNMKFRYQNPINFGYVASGHRGKGNGVNDMLVLNTKVRSEATGKIVSTPVASYVIEKGNWVDVVVHVKWSLAKDGFIEAWMRTVTDPSASKSSFPAYKPIVFKNNKQRYYGVTAGNSLGNYFKLGLYRKQKVNDRTTGIIFYDEFRRGNSFNEVALKPKKSLN